MKRPQLNFVVDAASFVAFLLLLTTGLALRYQLPPGSGGLEGHGGGPGSADRTVTLLLGLSRHEWGSIHFWIAVVLLAVLALHVALHWNWIICIVRGKQQQSSGWRLGLGIASLLALIVLATVPLAAPTEPTSRQQLQDEVAQPEIPGTPISNQFRGSSTLAEIAAETGIPVDELRDQLGLPPDASAAARIGPLLRESGKHMSDLRRLVARQAAAAAPNDKEATP
jgi:hypothetical protein